MSALTFRHAMLADKPVIVDFMNANWGTASPLIAYDDFFDHYYRTPDTLQFAFAEEDGVPVALAGYIRANTSDAPDIWVSIWCAVKGKNGAGLELMAALPALSGARAMACNNIRPKTMPFYTFLGYTAARLPHFYRLADKTAYAVARVAEKIILPAHGDAVLTRIGDAASLAQSWTPDKSLRPYKDLWYVTRRYFAYPRQTYDVWQSENNLLITRTVGVNGTKILRIVDFVGKPQAFACLGSAIDRMMRENDIEYADCYCYGIPCEIFAVAGFCERTENDVNINPNYLNPPLYENTEYYFFTDEPTDFTMFKADGDQDRPNLVL